MSNEDYKYIVTITQRDRSGKEYTFQLRGTREQIADRVREMIMNSVPNASFTFSPVHPSSIIDLDVR